MLQELCNPKLPIRLSLLNLLSFRAASREIYAEDRGITMFFIISSPIDELVFIPDERELKHQRLLKWY
ncbi:MAG: hypothetical protein V7K25_01095 [Nostoc sp.]|uniref:hypothetical protein n=1 Tax=Nostoc sp. TaxID=1180 RepID=UPI002FF98B07